MKIRMARRLATRQNSNYQIINLLLCTVMTTNNNNSFLLRLKISSEKNMLSGEVTAVSVRAGQTRTISCLRVFAHQTFC